MICEDCKQRPATVHYAQSINGQNTELHLCQDCYAKRVGGQFMINPNFLALNVFSQLAKPLVSPLQDASAVRAPILKCADCGLHFQQFLNSSLLGCPNCYTAFRSQLEHLMRQFQAGLRHQGKIPLRRGGTTRLRRKIQKIRMELQKAVELEQFEKAAQLRDELRNLEQSAEQEGKNNG